MTGRGWRPLAFLLAHARLRATARHGLAVDRLAAAGRGGRRGPRARAPQWAGSVRRRERPALTPRAREDDLRNTIRLLIGMVVSAACLYFATRGTDWADVGRVLRGAHLPWVAAAAAFGVAALAIRAQRWRLILRPVASVPFGPRSRRPRSASGPARSCPCGWASSCGPRCWLVASGSASVPALSSVVLERLFDMLFVRPVLPGRVADLADCRPTCVARRSCWARWRASGSWSCSWRSATVHACEGLLERVFGVLPARIAGGLRPLATRVLRRARCARTGHILGRVVLYSALLWAAIALPFLFALLALDIDVPLVPAAPGVDRHRRGVRVPAAGAGVRRHLAGRLRPRAAALRRAEGPGRRATRCSRGSCR